MLKNILTFRNKLKGAWLKLKELQNLNVQIKWMIPWQSGWTRYCKVSSISEIWAHRSKIWGQIIRTHTFTCWRKWTLVRKSRFKTFCYTYKRFCSVGSEYVHRKSIIRRPSHNLPDGLWKNVRPFGGPNLSPSPSE